jgi:hypothetical protein
MMLQPLPVEPGRPVEYYLPDNHASGYVQGIVTAGNCPWCLFINDLEAHGPGIIKSLSIYMGVDPNAAWRHVMRVQGDDTLAKHLRRGAVLVLLCRWYDRAEWEVNGEQRTI